MHSPLYTSRWPITTAVVIGVLALAIMAPPGRDFALKLTQDRTGLEMVELAKRVPREGGRSVLMIPWGPRHTAVAFSIRLSGENAGLRLVDHKADFRSLLATGDSLYTDRDTFYRFPLAWWEQQVGHVYLSASALGLVAIRTAPNSDPSVLAATPVAHGVTLRTAGLCLAGDDVQLRVLWSAERPPDADLSVFVHLLGPEGGSQVPLAQADSSAPVYGWYPTTRWTAGEVVEDYYVLPRTPGGVRVAFGMYEQSASGLNYGTTVLPLEGAPACPTTGQSRVPPSSTIFVAAGTIAPMSKKPAFSLPRQRSPHAGRFW